MEGLGGVGFSIMQFTHMRKAPKTKWALAATVNFLNNYQKSICNKNNLFKKSLTYIFLAIFSNTFLGEPPEPPIRCQPLRLADVRLAPILLGHKTPALS